MKIIGLLSDFGLRDSYVSEMKAVILSICPEATMVDISHEIRKFDVRMGAFVLASAARSFPKGSTFLAVVDPEVGSKRAPLIVESQRSMYVGPDNGLLMMSAFREGLRRVYKINSHKYIKESISATFHGRDIFARVAGELAMGTLPRNIGSAVSNYVDPGFREAAIEENAVNGEVLHVDDFGNIVTNIDTLHAERIGLSAGKTATIMIGRKRLNAPFVRTYIEIPERTVGCLIGSHGFFEIAMNRRNASRAVGARSGSKVTVRA